MGLGLLPCGAHPMEFECALLVARENLALQWRPIAISSQWWWLRRGLPGRMGMRPVYKEVSMAEEKKTYTFRCLVCGYEVTVDTPELPEDFVCPMCGVGPDEFELVED